MPRRPTFIPPYPLCYNVISRTIFAVFIGVNNFLVFYHSLFRLPPPVCTCTIRWHMEYIALSNCLLLWLSFRYWYNIYYSFNNFKDVFTFELIKTELKLMVNGKCQQGCGGGVDGWFIDPCVGSQSVTEIKLSIYWICKVVLHSTTPKRLTILRQH